MLHLPRAVCLGNPRSFARMLNDNRRDNLLVSLHFNLARSEAIHQALKQVWVLDEGKGGWVRGLRCADVCAYMCVRKGMAKM